MAEWVVVMTKPNCEGIAKENLLQQGYGCYYPKFQTLVGAKLVRRPLFPRYIFAEIDKLWYSIRGTRGVSHLLMADRGPATVPGSVIEALKAKENGEGYIVLGKDTVIERFEKGASVKATEGPLAGLNLIYDGMKDAERVKVLANLLGREVPVIIQEKILVAS